MLLKIVFTCVPADVIIVTAARAISAASNAYSMRSWPSSARTNARMRVMRLVMVSIPPGASIHDALFRVCDLRSRTLAVTGRRCSKGQPLCHVSARAGAGDQEAERGRAFRGAGVRPRERADPPLHTTAGSHIRKCGR